MLNVLVNSIQIFSAFSRVDLRKVLRVAQSRYFSQPGSAGELRCGHFDGDDAFRGTLFDLWGGVINAKKFSI